MGGGCSTCCSDDELQELEVNYESLQFLDIVLIRSKVQLNGFGIDARIGAGIAHNENPGTFSFSRFDRVGFITLDSYVDPRNYSPDNIIVREADYKGIHELSLREILEHSEDVFIRHLVIANENDDKQLSPEERKARYDALGWNPHGAGKVDQKLCMLSQDDNALVNPYRKKRFQFLPHLFKDGEEAKGLRTSFLADFFRKSAPLMSKDYTESKHKMKPVFDWVNDQLDGINLTHEQLQQVTETVREWDKGNGIEFDDLVPIFNSLLKIDPEYNCFSNEDIFELVSMFPYDMIKKTGHRTPIEVDNFVEKWKQTMDHAALSKKQSAWWSMLSGGFVSYLLQQMGILEEGKFYHPIDFSEDGDATRAPFSQGVWLSPELIVPKPPQVYQRDQSDSEDGDQLEQDELL